MKKRRNLVWICLFLLWMMGVKALGETGDLPADQFQTPHACLMELTTGKILYEKDADVRVHPASVTKVMTMLLIYEALENGKLTLQQEVVTSAHAKSMGGSQVFLEEGEKQTVETMLKCIVIASGNDAAVAMAEQVSGTEQAFVDAMNQKAAELGMDNTHFEDCCGLTDAKTHYTSAKDMAIATRELLARFPQVLNYSSVWMEDIVHVTAKGSSTFTLTNTNKLLRMVEGCDGLKTGSTSYAKYCLSATAKRGEIRLISVVMTAPDSKTRFAEAGELLGYGFAKCSFYHDREMPKLQPIQIKGAGRTAIEVGYPGDFTYLSTTGEDFSKIEREVSWDSEVKAPLKRGSIVGKVVYRLGDKQIGSVPILTSQEVEEAGYLHWLNALAFDMCL